MLKIIENLTFNYLQINKTKNVSTSKYLFSSIYTKGLFKEIISKKKVNKNSSIKEFNIFWTLISSLLEHGIYGRQLDDLIVPLNDDATPPM